MSDGPVNRYQAALNAGEIQYDDAQQLVVEELQRLFDELTRTPERQGLFSRVFVSKIFGGSADGPISGLYLWGGVGRGKTYLMDIFYECLPFDQKTRLHFHRFMRLVHRRLKENQGTPDPLKHIAAKFAEDARVICFDEFFVSDITDAMLLATLLEELFRRGVVLVATSNVEPKNLYKNGLQRRKFLPAIDLIYENTVVLNVDGDRDHRLRALQSAEIYHSPLDQSAEDNLRLCFSSIAPDISPDTSPNRGEEGVALEIEGRTINAFRCAEGVVWFDFYEICDGPRSQNDYIELARLFQTVLVANVPKMEADNLTRRFISLVDEFYDRNVKLILSAAVPVEELYAGNLLSFEFERTVSRLKEMQSQEYLATEHRP